MTTNPVRASHDALNELHAETATQLKRALKHQWFDHEGNATPPPAAIINVAINFLKMNGVVGPEITPKKTLDFIDANSTNAFAASIQNIADKLGHH